MPGFHAPCALQPTASFKVPVRQYRRQYHEAEPPRIAKEPPQLRHVIEIHAIDRSHKRRWQEHDGSDREWLDNLVLLQVDKSKRRIEQKSDVVGQKGCMAI